MSRNLACMFVLLATLGSTTTLRGDEADFAKTFSRSQYVHWIELYDADDNRIDPTAENAPPYSPQTTCGRCHDYDAITTGHHFNAHQKDAGAGRPGEPWIWTDPRTATQLPLSYRGWPGTFTPDSVGIAHRDFVLKFGRHLPGGGPGELATEMPEQPAEAADEPVEPADTPDDAEAAEGEQPSEEAEPEEEPMTEEEIEANRWRLSGLLNIDCMACHSNDRAYSREAWAEQVEQENFAWAPTAALGLGLVDGDVSGLPDEFDPAAAEPDSRDKLPTITYAPGRINQQKQVFFDVIRKPSNNACYYCHSTYPAGEDATPDWNHDEDVHLRAGFACADCHPNGIAHHTVRGFEGEEHPTGQNVETLSCRGCHMNDGHGGGRMGAPKPLHKGLPPLHFEKLSCTACHSGPAIGETAQPLLTSLAHGLGLPTHETAPPPPGIVAPVLRQTDGMLYPHRIVWPAFWGKMVGDAITPLHPDAVYDATRKTLRVRRGSDFAETMLEVRLSSSDKKELLGEERAKLEEEELTEEERAKLAEAIATRGRENWQEKLVGALNDLKEIIADQGAEPVFVSAGKVVKLGEDGGVVTFEHDVAQPYAWKIGHDVRPARTSLGAKGCYDCHTLGAPLVDGTVTALGQAPDATPITQAMHEMAELDKTKLDAWAASFMGRTAFKYFGYAAMGVVALVLLAFVLQGITSLLALGRRQ